MSYLSVNMSLNSSVLNLVKLHYSEMWVIWQLGNLELAFHDASITYSLFYNLIQMDMIILPMWTLGLPKGALHTCLEFVGPSTGQKLVAEFPGKDWFSISKQSLIAYISLSRGGNLWDVHPASPSFSNSMYCAPAHYNHLVHISLSASSDPYTQAPLGSLVSKSVDLSLVPSRSLLHFFHYRILSHLPLLSEFSHPWYIRHFSCYHIVFSVQYGTLTMC